MFAKDGLNRSHSNESGHNDSFWYPEFRVAVSLAQLVGAVDVFSTSLAFAFEACRGFVSDRYRLISE
jgi:hypothetical protein